MRQQWGVQRSQSLAGVRSRCAGEIAPAHSELGDRRGAAADRPGPPDRDVRNLPGAARSADRGADGGDGELKERSAGETWKEQARKLSIKFVKNVRALIGVFEQAERVVEHVGPWMRML